MRLKSHLFILFVYSILFAQGQQLNTVKDIRDGKVYKTVLIGNQIWMAQNLDAEKYLDGTLITQITEPNIWSGLSSAAWCWYGSSDSNGEVYGKLYNWYAVMGIYNAQSLTDVSLRKKICPDGWRIPSDKDWSTLVKVLGKNSGGFLKNDNWPSPNTGHTKSVGFDALPGGYRDSNGFFDGIGEDAYWWSSTEYDTGFAWNRSLFYDSGTLTRYAIDVKNGYSVRCLIDKQ